jgi:hypothetical protein
MPVLRGFSRNVKQDSEANAVSGGVSAANVPGLRFAPAASRLLPHPSDPLRVASAALRLPVREKPTTRPSSYGVPVSHINNTKSETGHNASPLAPPSSFSSPFTGGSGRQNAAPTSFRAMILAATPRNPTVTRERSEAIQNRYTAGLPVLRGFVRGTGASAPLYLEHRGVQRFACFTRLQPQCKTGQRNERSEWRSERSER